MKRFSSAFQLEEQMMQGGGRLADWPVHQFCQVLRRFGGQSSFEQICSIKISPKIGRRKPGNNGLCGHHTEASMHPGSSALHPLLCGGSTTTTSLLLFFLQQRRFSSSAELPCSVSSSRPGAQQGGCGCCEGPSRLRSRRQV